MLKKWYLQTWFICLMFAFWFFIVPGIIGAVLLIIQIVEQKKLIKKYDDAIHIDEKIRDLQYVYREKDDALSESYKKRENTLRFHFEETVKNLEQETDTLKSEKEELNCELQDLKFEIISEHYKFSDYAGLSSEECKNKLSLLKLQEQESIKKQTFFEVSSKASQKVINDNQKQLLRCFNAECDNILLGLSQKNIDSMRTKITKSFESLNKIFSVDGVQLCSEALELKLEELNLVYTYELKRQQELDLQKEIKAQMLEEDKVRREIEKQKSKIEKDQKQFSNEINKLMKYMQKSQNDTEKNLYIDKIHELEEKLRKLEEEKESVLEREANAKAGFVYIISNIGSFGEDVYKIGMTRRLEPMDRIKELSSASVPFEFDVHAMIFSDNAPELENTLHKFFEKKSVNRINLRKEFFHVSLDEIEKVVIENYNNTVEFTRVPVASEYRQTLRILESESA